MAMVAVCGLSANKGVKSTWQRSRGQVSKKGVLSVVRLSANSPKGWGGAKWVTMGCRRADGL